MRGRFGDPGACLEGLWRRVPGYIRLTFCAALVSGLAAHLYMFTNKLANHDDIGHLFSMDYGTASGRWLLPVLTRLDGALSMPWLIGLVSLLCLAGTACLTVSLLRIRRPLGCILTAALTAVFPVTAATFAYMFSADAYFFSLLLAAFGAYAAVRWGWRGSALGAAAVTLSLGVYQAYFPVAAALMVGALLLETLDGDKPFRALLLEGVRLALTLAAGLAAYLVIVKLTTLNTGLVDYMGLQDMGKLSLSELPRQLLKAYGEYWVFFIRDEAGCHFGFLKYAFALTGLGTLALGVAVLVRRRLGALRTALALVLAVLFPLAADLIYLMVPSGVHTLMIYGLCELLILPIALAEYARPVLAEGRSAAFRAAADWVICVTLALAAWSYAVADNAAYLKIDLGMRQCAAYSDRLLARIESCEGYAWGMDVVLVGSGEWDGRLYPAPTAGPQLIGVLDMDGFRTAYSYDLFLRYYLGYTGPVYTGGSQRAQELADTPEVQAMPCYPDSGSIRVVDGAVVAKLG